MQARSALFDLFGDHLRPRGGAAPVASLVRMLAPLGIAAPAVRTAISRMVQQGWLQRLRLPTGPGYTLTPKATQRLDEAAARIYRSRDTTWDGRWHLLVLRDHRRERAARTRLAASLSFLGYGALDGQTWVSPRRAAEVDAILTEASVDAEQFFATHAAGADGSEDLARRAWDLDALGKAYQQFVEEVTPLVESVAGTPGDERAFAVRSQLVHSWRGFLFIDPGLPTELLPVDWPGTAAAEFFDHHARALWPAASRFVDQCLSSSEAPSTTPVPIPPIPGGNP